jgi:hypothetical protein
VYRYLCFLWIDERYLVIFYSYIHIFFCSTILTPHVLSEWMVEVCAGYYLCGSRSDLVFGNSGVLM